MNFDLEDITTAEFQVALNLTQLPVVSTVMIGPDVKAFLLKAVVDTITTMRQLRAEPVEFDPANLYPIREHLFVNLERPLYDRLHHLYDYENSLTLVNTIEILPKTKLYAVRLTDGAENVLLAVKSVPTFGKRLGKPGRVEAQMDELVLADSREFQLDSDFDFFIEDDVAYIHHRIGFETVAQIREVIKSTIRENIAAISPSIEFVDFGNITSSTKTGITHARLLSTIKSRGYAENLTQTLLEESCVAYEVLYEYSEGKMVVSEVSHLRFLRILARQMLEVELREGEKERFFSSGREPFTAAE